MLDLFPGGTPRFYDAPSRGKGDQLKPLHQSRMFLGEDKESLAAVQSYVGIHDGWLDARLTVVGREGEYRRLVDLFGQPDDKEKVAEARRLAKELTRFRDEVSAFLLALETALADCGKPAAKPKKGKSKR